MIKDKFLKFFLNMYIFYTKLSNNKKDNQQPKDNTTLQNKTKKF